MKYTDKQIITALYTLEKQANIKKDILRGVTKHLGKAETIAGSNVQRASKGAKRVREATAVRGLSPNQERMLRDEVGTQARKTIKARKSLVSDVKKAAPYVAGAAALGTGALAGKKVLKHVLKRGTKKTGKGLSGKVGKYISHPAVVAPAAGVGAYYVGKKLTGGNN